MQFIFKYVLKNHTVIISLNKSLQESYNHNNEESKEKNAVILLPYHFLNWNYSLAMLVLYTVKKKISIPAVIKPQAK